MSKAELAPISELSDSELDTVAGGGYLVIAPTLNVATITQTNVNVLSFDEVAQSNSAAVAQAGAGGSAYAWSFAKAYAR